MISLIKSIFTTPPVLNYEILHIKIITNGDLVTNGKNLVIIKKNMLPIPDSCFSIVISDYNEDYDKYSRFTSCVFSYDTMLLKIPESVKKILFDTRRYSKNIHNLLNNLPTHIEEIELSSVWTNGSEILPNLTNLPTSLKKISCLNLISVSRVRPTIVCEQYNPDYSYLYPIHKFNIKLPFDCKLYLCDRHCANPDNLLIKLIPEKVTVSKPSKKGSKKVLKDHKNRSRSPPSPRRRY
jgi:hypothetical protein